ncbi:glycosyltransferase family 4 protein [Frankia sp. R82]|uniref:glycosyltransferase family 4 protein n=1 Tax=Frankia sp. R82 TaxID=2950553 RepID=UPI0020437771|nr:glycosyltransferase family 4 protein [Frankia sp. R82]MCM3883364.1 glycosyltransferase family 4 protein [Frankia sp. R82]
MTESFGSIRALCIVFFCEQYPPVVWDGAGTYTAALAVALAGLGHDVHVLCAQGHQSTDSVEAGVHVHRRPLLRIPVSRALGPVGTRLRGPLYPRDSLSLRASLPLSYSLWMRQLGLHPDIIETQDGETRGLVQAMRRSHPLAIHLHCPTMLTVRLSGEPIGIKGSLADRIDRTSANRAAVVTSPSQLLVDTLRDSGWLSRREVEVIPNPFDASPWHDIGDVAETEPTIAVIGRLEAYKGVDVVLEASARLRGAGVAHKLILAGRSAGMISGTPSGQWLARRAAQLGLNVELPGHLSAGQVREVYRQARVVAVPSRFESFSIVAAEAMAAGRPVVTTTRTGVAPFVQRWEAGAAVAPDDPGALADALAPCLLDAARASVIGAHGRIGVAEIEPTAIARRKEQAYRRGIAAFDARNGRRPRPAPRPDVRPASDPYRNVEQQRRPTGGSSDSLIPSDRGPRSRPE